MVKWLQRWVPAISYFSMPPHLGSARQLQIRNGSLDFEFHQ